MRDSTGFLARVKEYIEQREEKIEGEWGHCRSLKKLIADGDMPDVYFEVLQLINSVESKGELTDQELLRCAKIGTPCYNVEGWRRELDMMRAAIAADRSRFGSPTVNPIPVSERMPEPKDCSDSGMFWAWAENTDNMWELTDIDGMNWENLHHHGYTHWLPYWALPLPSPSNQHG